MLNGRPEGLDLPAALAAEGLASIPVVFLSSYDSPYFVNRAREAGAAGYLAKTASLATLVSGIETAAAGLRTFPDRALASGNPRPRNSESSAYWQSASRATRFLSAWAARGRRSIAA